MINNKKAVSGVVTAVLLILLVIAAVGILWVVVQNFVKQGTGGVESSAGCLSTDLEIVSTDITTESVTVKRNGGSATIDEIRIFVDGSNEGTAGFGAGLETGESVVDTVSINLIGGETVEVAAVIGGSVCPTSDIKTA